MTSIDAAAIAVAMHPTEKTATLNIETWLFAPYIICSPFLLFKFKCMCFYVLDLNQ